MLVGEEGRAPLGVRGASLPARYGPTLGAPETRPLETVSSSLTQSLAASSRAQRLASGSIAKGLVALPQEGPCGRRTHAPASEEGLT